MQEDGTAEPQYVNCVEVDIAPAKKHGLSVVNNVLAFLNTCELRLETEGEVTECVWTGCCSSIGRQEARDE